MLFISVFMFQRDGSPVLEKDISRIVKLARDWEKIYNLKGQRIKIKVFLNKGSKKREIRTLE